MFDPRKLEHCSLKEKNYKFVQCCIDISANMVMEIFISGMHCNLLRVFLELHNHIGKRRPKRQWAFLQVNLVVRRKLLIVILNKNNYATIVLNNI